MQFMHIKNDLNVTLTVISVQTTVYYRVKEKNPVKVS